MKVKPEATGYVSLLEIHTIKDIDGAKNLTFISTNVN